MSAVPRRRSSRMRSQVRRKRTGAPVARLHPTGDGDTVQVLWWNGERWGTSGPFGIATMALDQALDDIANEPDFRINA